MVKVESYEVPEGLYYSKDFEWIKIEGDKIRMGITDYAQKSLREIVYAELPSAGTQVKQGEPYGTLESVKAVSDLVAAAAEPSWKSTRKHNPNPKHSTKTHTEKAGYS